MKKFGPPPPPNVPLPSHRKQTRIILNTNIGKPQNKTTNISNKKNSRNLIVGNKQFTEGCKIKSAPRFLGIYVGNCDTSIDCNVLKEYIMNETNITVKACELISHADAQMRSFKVTVNVSERDQLLSANVCPVGVTCRKFLNKRKNWLFVIYFLSFSFILSVRLFK